MVLWARFSSSRNQRRLFKSSLLKSFSEGKKECFFAFFFLKSALNFVKSYRCVPVWIQPIFTSLQLSVRVWAFKLSKMQKCLLENGDAKEHTQHEGGGGSLISSWILLTWNVKEIKRLMILVPMVVVISLSICADLDATVVHAIKSPSSKNWNFLSVIS